MQDDIISIANALEILQSCTKPSICCKLLKLKSMIECLSSHGMTSIPYQVKLISFTLLQNMIKTARVVLYCVAYTVWPSYVHVNNILLL